MTELTFVDGDAVEVFYRRWNPNGDARAIVAIVHGASEHSGRYARLAKELNAEGYVVYALDQRGHGRTGKAHGAGSPGPRGLDGMLDDISGLIERAREDNPDLPVVLFGHSMGAVVVQAAIERRPLNLVGVVLSGTTGPVDGIGELAAGLDELVNAGMADEPIDMLGGYNAAFEPARTPFDWLSRDDAEVDKYIADPLCGDGNPLSYSYAVEVLQAVSTTSEPDGIAAIPEGLAVLLVTGEHDPVSNSAEQVRDLESRLRAAGLEVRAHYYPDARHELFNETNCDEVTGHLIAWLNDVVPK